MGLQSEIGNKICNSIRFDAGAANKHAFIGAGASVLNAKSIVKPVFTKGALKHFMLVRFISTITVTVAPFEIVIVHVVTIHTFLACI